MRGRVSLFSSRILARSDRPLVFIKVQYTLFIKPVTWLLASLVAPIQISARQDRMPAHRATFHLDSPLSSTLTMCLTVSPSTVLRFDLRYARCRPRNIWLDLAIAYLNRRPAYLCQRNSNIVGVVFLS